MTGWPEARRRAGTSAARSRLGGLVAFAALSAASCVQDPSSDVETYVGGIPGTDAVVA